MNSGRSCSTGEGDHVLSFFLLCGVCFVEHTPGCLKQRNLSSTRDQLEHTRLEKLHFLASTLT